MTLQEGLQLTNLFFIPVLFYIVKLEHRLAVLETHISMLLERLKPRSA
jgi:hypothetical protein